MVYLIAAICFVLPFVVPLILGFLLRFPLRSVNPKAIYVSTGLCLAIVVTVALGQRAPNLDIEPNLQKWFSVFCHVIALGFSYLFAGTLAKAGVELADKRVGNSCGVGQDIEQST